MPTIAMEAVTLDNNDNWNEIKNLSQEERTQIGIERFMKLLNIKIEEAKDMLLERFEYICAQPADSAKFMYENGLMAGYDGISTRSALQHGTLSLGQIGLAETLQILIGCDHTEPEGMKLAKE